MSPGEVVVEGVVVEQPAEPEAVRATTAGEVFCISEQTVSVPPGNVGLTFEGLDEDGHRESCRPVVTRVATRSPLFGRVHAGAKLVAVDGVGATPSNIQDVKGGIFTKGRKGLLDDTKAKTLIFQRNDLSGVKYVGRKGIVGLLMKTDAVVDVFAMDRGLFDAANAAKARTHWLHGEPGNLALFDGKFDGNPVQCCCVPPVPFLFVLGCLFGSLFGLCDCECWCCCCCRKSTPHEDMAFPDWADRALVFTDKGVVGRQEFTGKVNAITWDGFRIEDVRIRTFDAPCLCTSPHYALCCVEGGDPRFDTDPLETACYFGFLVPCCRCAFCRPEAPGLYRATISSIHKTQDHRHEHTTASIEVLALARSPDDLRSSLRAAKEKYGAPNAAEMAR